MAFLLRSLSLIFTQEFLALNYHIIYVTNELIFIFWGKNGKNQDIEGI
jgi:hypothetical protein